jgi:hypothetical protein
MYRSLIKTLRSLLGHFEVEKLYYCSLHSLAAENKIVILQAVCILCTPSADGAEFEMYREEIVFWGRASIKER